MPLPKAGEEKFVVKKQKPLKASVMKVVNIPKAEQSKVVEIWVQVD